MRCRPPLPALVTTAPRAPVHPAHTSTIAAAVAAAAVLLLIVVPLFVVGSTDQNLSTSGGSSTMMTSHSQTWRTFGTSQADRRDRSSGALSAVMTPELDIRWTTSLNESGSRPSATVSRPSRHLRYRHYRRRLGRHRRRHATTVSGLAPLLLRPHSETTSGRRRRRHRHVDDRGGTSGASVMFKVVEKPPDHVGDPIVLQAEPETDIDLVSGYFRFCNHRRIFSAVHPDCRTSYSRGVGRRGGVSSRCLLQLAAWDDEAEVIFQRFSDVMDLFDCRHAYSVASHCDDCKVRVVQSVQIVVVVQLV